jgi:hypothetical protein
VESAIKNAKDECATGSTAECAAAWDVVEEVSAAQADAKTKAKARTAPPPPRHQPLAHGARTP